jgi:hypothetical protein
MRINIKDAAGKIITLDCNDSLTVNNLMETYKESIGNKNKVIRSFTALYNGEMLSDEEKKKTLKELEIEDDEQIVISILYNGGKNFFN